jgi:tripartite-type tricarboxylate transporter receptor subunit TctC
MAVTRRKAMIGLGGMAAAPASLAQPSIIPAWPSRPLRLVVTFAPGGSTDLIARLVATGLQERLGQPVIVENRAGAGGTIATTHVARTEPDGYTMVLASSTVMAIGPSLYRNVQYDPIRDFSHVVLLSTNHLVFVTNNRVPAQNLNDLVRLARATNGGLNMASSGSGSLNHMLIVLFGNVSGATLNHVAYRGAGPAMAAVLGGEVHGMSDSLPSAASHIKQGSVRAISIAGESRSPSFPDVPTFREQGFDLMSYGWFGLSMPSATPTPILDRLHREVSAVLKTPHVVERMAEFDATPGNISREAYSAMVRADYERWGPLVRASGAMAD